MGVYETTDMFINLNVVIISEYRHIINITVLITNICNCFFFLLIYLLVKLAEKRFSSSDRVYIHFFLIFCFETGTQAGSRLMASIS